MSPEELKAIIAAFPNESKRHHHALIRQLANELLQAKFENVLLKAMVPAPVQLLPCEEDAA